MLLALGGLEGPSTTCYPFFLRRHMRCLHSSRRQPPKCLNRTALNASPSRTVSPPPRPAPLSSLSDPKPRNYGEVATTVENRSSAKDALAKSCYFKIDFGISEDATVYEAVQRFAAYNIGALAVTNDDKRVIGIVSERDYVSKVREGKKDRSEIAAAGGLAAVFPAGKPALTRLHVQLQGGSSVVGRGSCRVRTAFLRCWISAH